MFLEQKNNHLKGWKPSIPIKNLHQRADILKKVRQFFYDRNVLEVETPLLSTGTSTDPYVLSIPATVEMHGIPQIHYLQTSPEYAMKRLLAAGSGSIFQICKAFRQGDKSPIHHPEFTMLEWYRIGFDHHDLMDEMDLFLREIINTLPAERFSYQTLFEKFLKINPHEMTVADLKSIAREKNIDYSGDELDLTEWLNLLLTHCIEPLIGIEKPCFLYDFPAEQAALAKIRDEKYAVASRFEVYYRGVELANGFHELQCAKEQAKRFESELKQRINLNLPQVAIDYAFLQALENGLPDCAGVALGIDRLLMLALKKDSIGVVSFL